MPQGAGTYGTKRGRPPVKKGPAKSNPGTKGPVKTPNRIKKGPTKK